MGMVRETIIGLSDLSIYWGFEGWFLEFGSGTMILEKRSWDTIDCRGLGLGPPVQDLRSPPWSRLL